MFAFFALNIGNGMVILFLSKIQQLAWKGDTPFFLSTLTFLHGSVYSYEETQYMDFSISVEKFGNEFLQTWIYPFFGGNIELYKNGDYAWIGFSSIPIYAWIICVLLLIMIGLAVAVTYYSKNHRLELSVLLLVWLFNLCLHYVYGSGEAFMYTPHYIFIPCIVLAIGISHVENKAIGVVLLLIGALEFVFNLGTFRKLIMLTVNMLGTTVYSVRSVFIKSTLLGIFIFVLGFIWYNCINRIVKVREEISNQRKGLVAIFAYGTLIAISTFWIYFNC